MELLKKNLSLTIITVIAGFMLAIQFQTFQTPEVRDTRDLYELREDLKKAQMLQSEIIKEITKYEATLEKYETEQFESKETVLRETLQELRKASGLTKVSGPGLIIEVSTLWDEEIYGKPFQTITPQLLRRTINELNSYGAIDISIANHRLIQSSVIRDINGQTKIDDMWLRETPFKIVVLSNDVEKLYNRLMLSTLYDDFAIENLMLTISTPINYLTVPPYDGTIRIPNMDPVPSEKEGKA